MEGAAEFLSSCGAVSGDGELGPSSNIRIHSLASCVGLSQPTRMATITFGVIPSQLLLKRKQKARHWSIPFTFFNDVDPDCHVME